MKKLIFAVLVLAAPAAFAVEMSFGMGLDTQLSDNDLDPQGTFGHPDSDAEIGWAIVFHTRFHLSERFGLRTGGELVSRQVSQVYDEGIFFGTDGTTRYDVLSFDVPLFFEFYLGSGNHTLYVGPKVAFAFYDHCNQDITDFVEAKACSDQAVNDVFAAVQLGYLLRFSDLFGLNFFAERTVVPILDGGGITSHLFRTGAIATFYF